MKNISTGRENEPFDITGSLVYGLSLTFLMLGFSWLPGLRGIVFCFAGMICFVFFGILSMKSSAPVLDIKVFRGNTVFIYSNLAALINYSATFAVGFLLSLYLQFIKGYTPQHAGLILVAQPVLMMIVAAIAGRLSDSIEARLLSSAGMALITAGLGAFIFLSRTTPVYYIVICLVCIGFGFGLFSSPNTNAAMSSVDKRYLGVASATIGTMRLIGMMLSMGLIMVIFSVVIGRTKITPEYHGMFLHSVKLSFLLFAILCFGGIFPSMARGKVRKS
jgi:MFS family permease